ncbi:MAG TPA: hypothetical protein DEQ73_00080 [Phycisphaerales bacterium]|nr:hypothetical protein [Phycisphaerales bacterium]
MGPAAFSTAGSPNQSMGGVDLRRSHRRLGWNGPFHAQGHQARVTILGMPTAIASVNSEGRVWNPSAFLVVGR